MSKETQIAFVEKQLRTHGTISRNQCLREYITRLAAIIAKLEKHGYVIEGENVHGGTVTRWGRANDYKYTIAYKPKDSVFY